MTPVKFWLYPNYKAVAYAKGPYCSQYKRIACFFFFLIYPWPSQIIFSWKKMDEAQTHIGAAHSTLDFVSCYAQFEPVVDT